MQWGWGAIINFSRKKINERGNKNKKQAQDDTDVSDKFQYIVDVMVHIKPRANKNETPTPININSTGEMEIIPMLLGCIKEISSVVLMLPNDLIKSENKLTVKETFKEVQTHFKEELPILDPIKEMKISSKSLEGYVDKFNQLKTERDKIRENLEKLNIDINKDLEEFGQQVKLEKSVRFLAGQIEQGQKMVLDDDLKSMKRVMRRFGYIDKDDIVQLKGRVACEISACDEIILTELIYSGFFNDLTPQEVAGILTCMVHDESGADNAKYLMKHERLNHAFLQLKETAAKVLEVYVDCKINVEEEAYLNQFKPQLIEVTYNWCLGQSFADCCKLTDTYEGSIIRCLRRLEELLKQLKDCAKTIGNKDLQFKFEDASNCLRRGIVFAASLYL